MVLQGVSVITKQLSTWKIQKKTQFVEWSRCLKLELRGRVKMVIAWNGFAIESLQLQTWGVKYCKWQLEPACSSKQCKTHFFTAHCTHSTWSYAYKWCNTLQRVFPSKRRNHWSSKNIMCCGGGLSPDGRMRPLFHWEPSPLATWVTISGGRAIKITKSWGTAFESWKEIEMSIFHFYRPLFFSWEIRLQNPQVWSPQEKSVFQSQSSEISIPALRTFDMQEASIDFIHSCKTTKLAKRKKVQTTIYSKDRSNLGWISVLPENGFSLRTENCRRHFAIHLQVSCELVSTSLDMQIQIQKYKYSNINRQIQIDP